MNEIGKSHLVVAGAGDGDELARFVQQDAARTERLRRRYQPSAENSDEDDQDDYGKNKYINMFVQYPEKMYTHVNGYSIDIC